jgi:hypothetical protein
MLQIIRLANNLEQQYGKMGNNCWGGYLMRPAACCLPLPRAFRRRTFEEGRAHTGVRPGGTGQLPVQTAVAGREGDHAAARGIVDARPVQHSVSVAVKVREHVVGL